MFTLKRYVGIFKMCFTTEIIPITPINTCSNVYFANKIHGRHDWSYILMYRYFFFKVKIF